MAEDKINKQLDELFILYSDQHLLNKTLRRIIIENWSTILYSNTFLEYINQIKLIYAHEDSFFSAMTILFSCLKRFELPLTYEDFMAMFNVPLTDSNGEIKERSYIHITEEFNTIIDHILNIPLPSIASSIYAWIKPPNSNKFEELKSIPFLNYDEDFIPIKKTFNIKHGTKTPSKTDKNWRQDLIFKFKAKSVIKESKKDLLNKDVYLNLDNKTINDYISLTNLDKIYEIGTIIPIDDSFEIWSIVMQRKTHIILLKRNQKFKYKLDYIKGFKYRFNDIISYVTDYDLNYNDLATEVNCFITYYEEFPILGSIKSINKESYGIYIISQIKNPLRTINFIIPNINLNIEPFQLPFGIFDNSTNIKIPNMPINYFIDDNKHNIKIRYNS